jgi:hypothetical protein
LLALAAAATGIACFVAPEHRPALEPQAKPAAAESVRAAERAPQGSTSRLPARQTLRNARADPFAARSWAPPPPPPPPQVLTEGPPAPVAPPNPYRFAGTAHYGGSLKAVLAAGDRIHAVRQGELLDGLYEVLSVRRDSVTLLYTPLGVEQQIAFAEDAPSDRALAQAPSASPFPPGSPLAVR